MPTPAKVASKRETLNIRIKPEDRSVIDHAARIRGKNRTNFILDAVRLAAEEVLIEQTLLFTNPEGYAQFLARLERPPHINERLRTTMQTVAPWEKP